jgi:TrmH family RNA methyltransferase
VVWLSRDVFSSAVATEAPQGIAALLEPPRTSIRLDGEPLLLIAAGLQDPGNLGTLIRSAEAFGAAGFITTPGSVSPWNQKALRASAGSVFRVPIEGRSLEEVAALKQRGVQLIAAVAANGTAPDRIDLKVGCALMIGNEGAGLGSEWLSLADERITLHCPGPVESLNAAVAGSLLLYEASRQRASAASVQSGKQL